MLRIGIDATAIPSRRVGAGNYIFNLVRKLAEIDAENQYFVFSKPAHIVEWNLDKPNFSFLPISVGILPLRLAWEQTVLPAIVRRYKIDVLHSPHYTIPLLNPSRSVVTFCDMTFFLYPKLHSFWKRVFFNSMMRISSRRASGIITISESTKRDLLCIFKGISNKVHAIPLGVDSIFSPIKDQNSIRQICSRHGLQMGEYILFVGLLEPRKNIPILLHAFRELVDRGIQKRLAIVGKRGWMYDNIFSTVQSLDLRDFVVFTNYVPEEELPYLYNGACLFVYPSFYEGFGLPVLEAMSCGTPVVTSNISSMPEIVGDAGLLVDPYNVRQLANAILRIVDDDDYRRSMQERGLQRAAQFSWEKTARKTINVYLLVCT